MIDVERIADAIESIAESLAQIAHGGLDVNAHITVSAATSGEGFGIDLGDSLGDVGSPLRRIADVLEGATNMRDSRPIDISVSGLLRGIDAEQERQRREQRAAS